MSTLGVGDFLASDLQRVRQQQSVASRDSGSKRGQVFTLNFSVSEKCREIFFLSENFGLKVQNLRPKTPILKKFQGRIELLSIS